VVFQDVFVFLIGARLDRTLCAVLKPSLAILFQRKPLTCRRFAALDNHLGKFEPDIFANPVRWDVVLSALLVNPRQGNLEPRRQVFWLEQLVSTLH
jgi:hypothetical protein